MSKGKRGGAPKQDQLPGVEGATPAAQDAPAAAGKGPGSRGPRGVAETAVITILTPEKSNPKRPGSASHADFAKYVDGMTVGQFIDAVGKRATPHLVYDTAHGFISIEGYTPGKKYEPKPKKEKVAKEPKAPRAKKEKGAASAPLPNPDEGMVVQEETAD